MQGKKPLPGFRHLSHDALIRLCRAKDRLRETWDQPLTLHEVARETAMSPYHFIRQFGAVFGQTPHEFRIAVKLEHAKRLLIIGDQPVTEVCLELGYASLGSFSDLFTRRVGVAPSAYRRQMRALVQIPGTFPREMIPHCFALMYGIAQFPRSAPESTQR